LNLPRDHSLSLAADCHILSDLDFPVNSPSFIYAMPLL
jgi:hypothetical protein